ncbi:DEAD/DEAH box helicase [Candidatus Protochlamydia amoebophila]|uniref:DEAD/DEAH box helicase n=1 Tax=Candidatus Protochlamydia amoebophila TaxID=362787 RepID=UPI0003034DF9|nr:DEAD/DEAH box helicase [Candidatus Protochlamydia amoebophila]
MNEIGYTLDIEEMNKTGFLTLKLTEVIKEGYHHRLHYPLAKNLAKWKASIQQDREKEIFTSLFKEEVNYQTKLIGRSPSLETTTSPFFHISSNQAVNLLNLLGSLQKIYLNNKQLVVDFVGKVEFYYEVFPLNTSQIEIKGHLKWRDQDIDIASCDCIGPGKPVWFVRGISLKGITTFISWKELQRAYQTRPWILEGSQKAAFLEEFEENDSNSPQLMIKGHSIENLYKQTEPLPFLILKDRSGGFADLWLNYGNGLKIAFHELKKTSFKRQEEVEKNFEKDLLETDFIKKNVGTSHYYCPLDKVAKSLTFLLEIGWVILDWKENRVIKQDHIDLKLEDAPQMIKIKGSVRYETHEADVSSVLGAFNRRERFIQLNPGTVGLLPELHSVQELKELAEEGKIIGQEVHIKKSHIGALSSLFDRTELPSTLSIFKQKWENFKGVETALPAPSFEGHLRPYQQEGLNWLSFLFNYGFHGILADEMGLGKTVQVLAFISRFASESKHLIVVPTSLLFNWKNEICRFLPSCSCYIHQGSQRANSIEILQNYSIILTSYTTLRLDLSLLQKLDLNTLILDEAQQIKNAHTQTFQAACSLSSHFRLCITGTPIENHLGELWSHFHFLIPDLFGAEESFNADIQAASADRRYLDRIKKKVAPFILRRQKQEVAKDLPARIDQIVWIEMSESQRQHYEQFLANFKRNLFKKIEAEGITKHRLEVLEAILRLRQICCHPLLVSSIIEEKEDLITSAKFDLLMQDLQTIREEGRKVLVYSQFTSMLKLMTRYANQQGWTYAYLDGSTQNREKVVTEFQENLEQSIFFISLKAGGVGLNLTAADYVILYDPWWNEAVEEQAINRAHRIGRQEQVIAKRFVVIESIEEKMMKLKAAKRTLVDDIFDFEAAPTQLTIEDLRYLIS